MGYWDEVKEGVRSAQSWVAETSEKAASEVVDSIREAADSLGISGTATDAVAAAAGAVVETAGTVAGGVAMVGPNVMVAVSEVPDHLGHGAYEIYRGIKHDNWEPVVSGAGEIAESLGHVASAGLMVESAVQAVQTRAAVNAATAAADIGTDVEITAKPATGATPGTTYIRKVTDAESGDTLSKTTTVVSDEGVVVRQHTDFPGKYQGLRKGAGPEEAGGIYKGGTGINRTPNHGSPSPSGPTFPESWTGAKEIAGPRAPHHSRVKTVATETVAEQSKAVDSYRIQAPEATSSGRDQEEGERSTAPDNGLDGDAESSSGTHTAAPAPSDRLIDPWAETSAPAELSDDDALIDPWRVNDASADALRPQDDDSSAPPSEMLIDPWPEADRGVLDTAPDDRLIDPCDDNALPDPASCPVAPAGPENE